MSANESHDIGNSQSNSNISCNMCERGFTSSRGLLLHLNPCQRKQDQQNQQLEANDDQEKTHWLQDIPHKPINGFFYWNDKPGTTFVNEFNNAYGKMVYWRKNLFFIIFQSYVLSNLHI